jgi:AraC-like DNA-binding protein
MNRKTQVSRFSIVEADLDELRQHYARTLKPVKVSPITRGSTVSVEDLHFSTGDFDIWSGRCRSGMEVTFTEPPDAYAIYLPVSGNMELGSRGRHLVSRPGTIIAADLSESDVLRLHPERSHIGIAFNRDAVKQHLSELLDAPVLRDLNLATEVSLQSSAYARLAGLGQLLWDSLAKGGEKTIDLRSTEYLFRTILVSVLEGIPHHYSEQLGRPVSPAMPRQVKRAIDYMVANLGAALDVGDIAREAGVRVRALQIAFQQFKQMSPLDYLRHLRLEAVRRDILAGARGATVSDIARRCGFSHMGRFSAQYREAFGELPTESMQKFRFRK